MRIYAALLLVLMVIVALDGGPLSLVGGSTVGAIDRVGPARHLRHGHLARDDQESLSLPLRPDPR